MTQAKHKANKPKVLQTNANRCTCGKWHLTLRGLDPKRHATMIEAMRINRREGLL